MNFIYAKVEVTVQNGEITDIIILEHRHEHGKAAETVINEIVDEQRIDVDAVSGATNSSIVIKKAVENALKSGCSILNVTVNQALFYVVEKGGGGEFP